MLKLVFISGLLIFVGLIAGQSKSPKEVWITAHRGASGLAPENTLASVVLAMKIGANFAEIDVQETADGHLILLHDNSLKRTTDRDKNIWDLKLSDLRDVDAGSWFSPQFAGEPVPTFAQIVDAVRDKMKLNIELKMNGHQQNLGSRVVDLIQKKNFISQCIVTSFDREEIRKVKNLNPAIKTGYIFSKTPEEDLWAGEFDLISVGRKLVTDKLVQNAHNAGKEVHVWTVNKEEEMGKMIDLGVDNIITNYPDVLKKVLEEKDK